MYIHLLVSADYSPTTSVLIFTPTVSEIEVIVPVLQDSIVENTETFFVDLTVDDEQPVVLNPATAYVAIFDDADGMETGLVLTFEI